MVIPVKSSGVITNLVGPSPHPVLEGSIRQRANQIGSPPANSSADIKLI
jgi:hypothetical protein